ncbi:MAG: hypothetical protein V5A47_00015 [Bacteroidales bacterium]|nr:hypothetical protein [Bacteroidales bacterium]MBS3773883.1 hypothetical protein [Bacteroidales bacterium]
MKKHQSAAVCFIMPKYIQRLKKMQEEFRITKPYSLKDIKLDGIVETNAYFSP